MFSRADRKMQWDKVLHKVVAQYNRTIHSEAGKAPVDFFCKERTQFDTPREKMLWQTKDVLFTPFKAGDLVMQKIPFQLVGQQSKLSPSFDGPYRVESFPESEVVYSLVRMSDGYKVPRVRISQLNRYFAPVSC